MVTRITLVVVLLPFPPLPGPETNGYEDYVGGSSPALSPLAGSETNGYAGYAGGCSPTPSPLAGSLKPMVTLVTLVVVLPPFTPCRVLQPMVTLVTLAVALPPLHPLPGP
jgi:hypothetical protein